MLRLSWLVSGGQPLTLCLSRPIALFISGCILSVHSSPLLLSNLRCPTRPLLSSSLHTMGKTSPLKSFPPSFRRETAKGQALGKGVAKSLSSLKRANNMAKEACHTCRKIKKKCIPLPDASCEECDKRNQFCSVHLSSRTHDAAEAGQGEWEDIFDDTSTRAISVPSNGDSSHPSAQPISQRYSPTAYTPLPSPVNLPELDTAARDEAAPLGVPFVRIERLEWFGHDFNDVAPISNSRADEEDVPAWGRLRRVYLDQNAQ